MIENMKKLKRLIGYILNILIVIVVSITLIGMYYMAQITFLKKDYVNICGYTFFEVATGSMASTINVGDIVVVRITNEINENQIIVYRDGKDFIVHRIIRIDAHEIITRGDANNSEDTPIQKEQILGKVDYIIPKIGIWKKILLTPEILALIVGCIILLEITVFYFSKIKEEVNRKE